MDKIKRFITCNVPVTACNFNCQYCYLHDCKNRGIVNFAIKPDEFAKKFSKERLGGICYFNLCGDGETLLHPELIPFVKGLIEQGHYVDIITNGTLTNKFEELLRVLSNEEQGHLFIKFSFHYLQLKEHGWLDRFADNVECIRKSRISFTVEITPHDELIPYIDEIKRFSIERFGALPHITVARDKDSRKISILTKLSREEYKAVWGQFDSEMFNFKMSTFNVKRNEFCYAGDWSLFVLLSTGEYRKCYFGDFLGNICSDEDIVLNACGKCLIPHCFNGHAFLGLGCIPELETPTYLSQRDRVMNDGMHWVKEPIASFFASKLYESNQLYSEEKKNDCIRETNKYQIRWTIQKIVARVKRLMHINEDK